mgnify:CR=1 FL=1
MEVQKEAFSGLMEYYKLLPIQNKRDEIISTLEELISNYTKICSKFGVMPDMTLNKEILNVKNDDINSPYFVASSFSLLHFFFSSIVSLL